MPMIFREKRRSLHLGHGSKLAELTKEALSRPRSWYLPGSNVDIDPYTSVRKIFYEFPKKEFYGDATLDNDGVTITNDHSDISAIEDKENKNPKLNPNVQLKVCPSPVLSIRSTKSMDTNNNSATPKGRSNLLNKSYFSSRASDTASLKEESDNYAEFYVPKAKVPSAAGFLRRSHKRRSYDSAKMKDLTKRLDDELSVSSVDTASYVKRKSLESESITNLPNQEVDPQPLLERYLRDANQDICEGLYPAASESILTDPSCVSEDNIPEEIFFIPWNKRSSFIDASLESTFLLTESNTFQRRRNKRYSSLRRQKSFTLGSTNKKRPPLRRANTSINNDTISSRTSKNNSGESLRRQRMSSSSSLRRTSSDFNSLPRDIPRALKQQQRRNSKMAARFFFQGYQDKLREEMFSIEFPTEYDPSADPSSSQYEPLSKEFDAKILGKTYQQLYYIRSRLSESARKTKFQCDGCFGCDVDYQCTTQPQWV